MSYTQRRLNTLNAFINNPDTLNKPHQLVFELKQAVEEIERLQTELNHIHLDHQENIRGITSQFDNKLAEQQGLLKRWADISPKLIAVEVSGEQAIELKQLIEETRQCQQ